jgi:succinate-semialdehyde dehydrogenase/glutarate-semialdehyde dehydrogenase
MTYQSVNPSDGNTLKHFDKLSDSQLEASLAAAEACSQTWRLTCYAQRAEIIGKAAAIMRTHVDEFAKLATLEMGKRIDEARGEVNFSADILAYYAAHAEAFLAPTTLSPKVGEAHMESSPFGVLFCVEPWNFPFYQLARVAGPQLMAGNVLVVKHAGCVPQCAIAFEKLLIDAGAPKGAYTNLLISHEQSDRVIDDPRIKGVALTGSVAAGKSIAARAGQHLKKTSMELGGSDAFIVLDSIADRFLEKFKAALSELKPGDPMDEKTTHGPLSTEAALVQLLKQVDDAVAHGATLVMGGKRIDRPGSFMETTILTNIKPDNPAFRDEFFGPVVSFFRVKDEVAAIALANDSDSDFGLGGSVFTEDTARGKRVASAVETGMMFINNIDWSDAELPFGGIKDSGYGRELGNMGIQEFVNKKLVRTAHINAPA